MSATLTRPGESTSEPTTATLGQTRRRSRSFSAHEIIEAIRRWHAQYGECPRMIDWEPARARRLGQGWRAERFESGGWPSTRVVCGKFETFNAAIKEAGLAPRPPKRGTRDLPGTELVRLAFIDWARRYGDVPTMADWDPTRARRLGQEWRVQRYYADEWPNARTVALHFGSFAKAAAAAGLISRDRGSHHDMRIDERAQNREAAARELAREQTPGIDDLVGRVRAVAAARAEQNPVAIHAALIDLASTALALTEVLCVE